MGNGTGIGSFFQSDTGKLITSTAASTAIGAGSNWVNSKGNLKRNLRLADFQNEKNIENWNAQNAYNSPEAQMARLKKAGLNPNLVYGNGTVANNSSGLPPYQSPSGNYEIQTPPIDSLMTTLSKHQAIKNQKIQNDNVKANTLATQQKARNDAIRSDILGYQAEQAGVNLDQSKSIFPYTLEGKKANIAQTKAQTENQQAEAVFKRYRNKLNTMGIHTSDNLMLRMMIQNWEDFQSFFTTPIKQ